MSLWLWLSTNLIEQFLLFLFSKVPIDRDIAFVFHVIVNTTCRLLMSVRSAIQQLNWPSNNMQQDLSDSDQVMTVTKICTVVIIQSSKSPNQEKEQLITFAKQLPVGEVLYLHR